MTDGGATSPTGPTPPPLPRKRRRWRLPAAIVSGFVLLNLLFCSGLNFPILGAGGTFQAYLRDDFGLAPPPSTVVEHGARQAYRDASRFFKLRVRADEVPGFVAAVHAAARARGHVVEELPQGEFGQRSHFLGRRPTWFRPDAIRQWQWFTVSIDGQGYWWFYSPESGEIYVFWYET